MGNQRRNGRNGGSDHKAIQLPKALREELNLDERSLRPGGKRGGRGGGGGGAFGRPLDRKAQRKQQRQEKKSRQYQPTKGRSASQHHGHDEEDDDDVDPFDVSDDEDAIKIVKLPAEKSSKSKPETTNTETPKSKKRKHDEDEDATSEKKLSKKSKQRDLEPKSEDQPDNKKSKKHSNLSKGIKDKLEQDEAEISYLEKKLGIKGKKTPKSFEDDGLDFLLEGLDKDFMSGGEDGDDELEAYRREKAAKRQAKKVEETSEEEEEESDEDDMSDGLDGLLEGDSDEEEGNLEDFYTEDEEEDTSAEDGDDSGELHEEEEEFKGFSDAESDSETTEAPQPEEPPARTRPDPTKPFVASAAKYVPPSRRAALASAGTESESLIRLRRSTQGLLNRFSEANLLSILSAIETTYRENPRGDVTNVLTDIILTSICDKSSLLDTFVILYGGFVAGVYKLIGTDFGGNIVQKTVEQLEKYHAQSNGLGVEDNAGKEATNLMSFLAELYNFGVISSVLIFDYIRRFLSELTELHTELLLKVVRNSGPQLRSDDPTALKSLVALLQTSVTKAGGPEKLSTRTKFMIETLTNLKNNKLKNTNASGAAVTAEATTRMRKLLGTLNTRRLRATEPLRASLDDITNADKRGKWWLVGASWAGRPGATAPSGPPEDIDELPEQAQGSEEESDLDDELDEFDTSALMPQLIHQHRLNTPSRRAIFTTLLSATDYQDCTNRLLALRLPRSQLPEIARLTVHCAISEGVYNPYYTVLATHLSQSSKPVRTAFTYALYEHLDRIAELKLPQVVVLGRLYAGLVTGGITTVGQCVKTIERWKFVEGQVRAFLEVFLGTVVKDEGVWWEGQGLEGEVLEGIAGVMERWEKGIASAAGGGSEGRGRLKKVRKTLAEMRRRVVLGDD